MPPPGERATRRAADRLDSWKEVAVYLRRGERTVQRWEREEGLPVHRLQHEKRGSIYAYKPELDEWRDARGSRLESPARIREESFVSIAVLPSAGGPASGDGELVQCRQFVLRFRDFSVRVSVTAPG